MFEINLEESVQIMDKEKRNISTSESTSSHVNRQTRPCVKGAGGVSGLQQNREKKHLV